MPFSNVFSKPELHDLGVFMREYVAMILIIRRCFEIGLIDEVKRDHCLQYVSKEEFHVEVRNLIMMILLPKKLHVDDQSQAAYLRAAVSRVSDNQTFLTLISN